ncbi:MAG: hypothetical protein KatS3mg102_2494 [Planctomycetota bacterium]|nr:MAG: hypothetical protein KatS3mg102_2494 [Planctomycetota bacterium]
MLLVVALGACNSTEEDEPGLRPPPPPPAASGPPPRIHMLPYRVESNEVVSTVPAGRYTEALAIPNLALALFDLNVEVRRIPLGAEAELLAGEERTRRHAGGTEEHAVELAAASSRQRATAAGSLAGRGAETTLAAGRETTGSLAAAAAASEQVEREEAERLAARREEERLAATAALTQLQALRLEHRFATRQEYEDFLAQYVRSLRVHNEALAELLLRDRVLGLLLFGTREEFLRHARSETIEAGQVMKLFKRASTEPLRPGETFWYELELHNLADSPLRQVTVYDHFPGDLGLVYEDDYEVRYEREGTARRVYTRAEHPFLVVRDIRIFEQGKLVWRLPEPMQPGEVVRLRFAATWYSDRGRGAPGRPHLPRRRSGPRARPAAAPRRPRSGRRPGTPPAVVRRAAPGLGPPGRRRQAPGGLSVRRRLPALHGEGRGDAGTDAGADALRRHAPRAGCPMTVDGRGGLPGGAALALALLLGAVACGGGSRAPAPRERTPDASAPPVPGAAGLMRTPRLSAGGNALFAWEELRGLAAALLERVRARYPERTPRLAFYYITELERPTLLGEWVAQDLATLMVQLAHGRVEVYTRRKLATTIERELKVQASHRMDRETLARMGRLSGVQAIVLGKLWRDPAGDRLVLNCQAVDVETGETVAAEVLELGAGPVPVRAPVLPEVELAQRLGAELLAALPGAGEPAGAEPRWRLAVWDIARSKQEFHRGVVFADLVETGMVKAARPDVKLYARGEQLAQVLQEQRQQHASGRFDEETIVRLARLAGANAVVTGYAEFFPSFYAFNIQAIDVETARIWAGVLGMAQRR